MFSQNEIVYNPHRLRGKDGGRDVNPQTMGIVVESRANGAWVLFEDRDLAVFCTAANLKSTNFEVLSRHRNFATRVERDSPDAA